MIAQKRNYYEFVATFFVSVALEPAYLQGKHNISDCLVMKIMLMSSSLKHLDLFYFKFILMGRIGLR